MSHQTTEHGLTVEEIETTYKVLETLREHFNDHDLSSFATTVNEAHYLVQQYEQNTEWSDGHDYYIPDEREVVRDMESNPRYGTDKVRVTEVLQKPARAVWIKDGTQTVADANPSHPEDAIVIRGTYLGGSGKPYSFPCTRLEEIEQ